MAVGFGLPLAFAVMARWERPEEGVAMDAAAEVGAAEAEPLSPNTALHEKHRRDP
jgi:hypothetical protein